MRRSLDGGETWTTIGAAMTPGSTGRELSDPDIHGMVVSAASPTTVLTSTPGEIFASTDAGESWHEAPAESRPSAMDGEGAFAASGSSLAVGKDGAWLGSGGPAARLFVSLITSLGSESPATI